MGIHLSQLRRRGSWLIAFAVATGGTLLGACSSSGPADPGSPVDRTAAVDSVVVSVDSAEVTIGDTVRIFAVAVDAAGDPVPGIELTWTTSDPTVATVSSDGLVTAVDFGEADIDVTVAGPSAGSTAAAAASARGGRGTHRGFQVKSIPNIAITPGTAATDVTQPVTFSAHITNAKGAPLGNPPVPRWGSSVGSVATVDIAGQATPVGPGTTTISAQLISPISGQVLKTATAALTVTVCDGLLDVVSWTATVSTSYQVPTTVPALGIGESYTVDQSSSGTAVLVKTQKVGSTVTYEGPVTGTAHVDNRAVYPNGGVHKEIGDGPQSPHGLQFVRLTTTWIPLTGCRYSIRYRDQLKFVDDDSVSRVQTNVDIPLGMAVDGNRKVGVKPSSGWRLSDALTVKALYSPTDDNDELSDLLTQYYAPATNTAVSLLAVTPSRIVGTAKFNYTLIAP